MKYQEIKSLSKTERQMKLIEIQKELIKLNGQVVTGTPPKSPGRINQLKKDIARIKTFESELLKSKTVLQSKVVSEGKN